MQWHVYSACAESAEAVNPVYTLEMCMTGLDREKASVFLKKEYSCATVMTDNSVLCEVQLRCKLLPVSGSDESNLRLWSCVASRENQEALKKRYKHLPESRDLYIRHLYCVVLLMMLQERKMRGGELTVLQGQCPNPHYSSNNLNENDLHLYHLYILSDEDS